MAAQVHEQHQRSLTQNLSTIRELILIGKASRELMLSDSKAGHENAMRDI